MTDKMIRFTTSCSYGEMRKYLNKFKEHFDTFGTTRAFLADGTLAEIKNYSFDHAGRRLSDAVNAETKDPMLVLCPDGEAVPYAKYEGPEPDENAEGFLFALREHLEKATDSSRLVEAMQLEGKKELAWCFVHDLRKEMKQYLDEDCERLTRAWESDEEGRRCKIKFPAVLSQLACSLCGSKDEGLFAAHRVPRTLANDAACQYLELVPGGKPHEDPNPWTLPPVVEFVSGREETEFALAFPTSGRRIQKYIDRYGEALGALGEEEFCCIDLWPGQEKNSMEFWPEVMAQKWTMGVGESTATIGRIVGTGEKVIAVIDDGYHGKQCLDEKYLDLETPTAKTGEVKGYPEFGLLEKFIYNEQGAENGILRDRNITIRAWLKPMLENYEAVQKMEFVPIIKIKATEEKAKEFCKALDTTISHSTSSFYHTEFLFHSRMHAKEKITYRNRDYEWTISVPAIAALIATQAVSDKTDKGGKPVMIQKLESIGASFVSYSDDAMELAEPA